MELKNPIKQSIEIEKEFSRYIESTFVIRDQEYNDLFKKELEKMEKSLYKGPYLYSSLPFEPSYSLNDLVALKIIHPSFLKLGGIDKIKDRKLHYHQLDSLKKIEDGRSVVVTTGTGSGKTESFLFPILDTIIKEIENGNKDSGIRAVLLFPMNALINDQIDRIREILSGYKDIKFGFYTGETEENNYLKAKNTFYDLYGKEPSSNELLTREQMRDTPPHILFTNYSMLEYLLIRPQDEKLISEEALKYWKFVVLDEAHTYKGALGIEISLLLRRLCGAAKRKPQFILTSATLGKGKEDVDKITNFAKSLTSVEYEQNDVIFSTRRELKYTNFSIDVDPNDYVEILKSIESNTDYYKSIISKYIEYNEKYSIENNLFNFLSKDKMVYSLYHSTKDGMDFNAVLNKLFILNQESLVALVELISKATSLENMKLYDIKYHMFIKAPDGAFITLGKNKALSLLTCRTINDKKAFKIGICPNCNTPFVIGVTVDGVLSINDDVDMDEESQDKPKLLEYYLIKDCLTESEIFEIENDTNNLYTKYVVCSDCGTIKKYDQNVHLNCECNGEKVVLYKYNEEKDEKENVYSNNIKHCPICYYQTRTGGVVLGFHIGKDRATALISQILYESMYAPIEKKVIKQGLFSRVEEVKSTKQFIAFSDARQQAAFFNKFINATDDRFLKKAIIWDRLKESSHNPIAFCDLVTQIANFFQVKLKYEPNDASKHAYAAALWELLNVDGKNSAEGLALFAFKLNLPDDYYNDKEIEEILKGMGFDITAEQFRVATQFALDIFRTVPAITYPPIALKGEMDDLLSYRKFVNYVDKRIPKNCPLSEEEKRKIHSFLPINPNQDNKLVRYIKRAFSYDKDKAEELLNLIYETAKDTNIIKKQTLDDQIDCQTYSVHSYKNLKYYYCPKCKKVTIYNINNKCIDGDCSGELIEMIDPDNFLKNNYYRVQYINRPRERVLSREHTAQIKTKEARKIQRDFKDKKLNIISCSTTFEMGIDLGSLNTVFMRNIPPSPANYVQRAGRAGRRTDTSAYILTFCSVSSHDYTFFNEPLPMIQGIVDPPSFIVDNDKIIVRHIMATALSFYFKLFPNSFIDVNTFLDEEHIDKFIDYVESKPYLLDEYLENYVFIDEYTKLNYGNYKWIDLLVSSKSTLINMKIGLEETINLYLDAIDKLKDSTEVGSGKLKEQYIAKLKNLKHKNSLIQYLAKYNVIPKYGFPIDNVQLLIYDPKREDFDDKYDLTRNLSVAISEYAPESEVIVDGKKFTSRYIYTPYSGAPQEKNYYIICKKCESYNVYETDIANPLEKCCYCNTQLPISEKLSFVKPVKGFVTDRKNKERGRMKPVRSFASEVRYIGKGTGVVNTPVNISNVVKVTEYRNEELLVLNENPFFYCETCGYTVLDKLIKTKVKKEEHNDHKDNKCPNNQLVKTHLGHSYMADLIKIEFFGIEEMKDKDNALSTLYALLEGMSTAFNIERTDIGGMIFNTSPGYKAYEIILFDTVPGGAGHVKKLQSKDNVIKLFEAGKKKAGQNCCQEDTSCYSCLRNFNNQRIHKHLVRGKALNTIEKILREIDVKNTKIKILNVSKKIMEHEFTSDFVSGLLDDETSINVFENIFNQINGYNWSKPNFFGVVFIDGETNRYNVDLCWKDEKILLFSLDNEEDYYKFKKIQNEYSCYLLDDNLNINDFIERIKK